MAGSEVPPLNIGILGDHKENVYDRVSCEVETIRNAAYPSFW